MQIPVIVLRPEPGCGETLDQARALGLNALGFPLFEIEPVSWDVPDPALFDGILAGSANAFRHGGSGLERLRGLSVYAVGERTAAAARQSGFTVAASGARGLQPLLDALPPGGNFLRLAGEARVPLTVPPCVSLTERVVYRAIPRQLPHEAAARLKGGAIALLHSGEAGRHFAVECDRLGLDRSRIGLATLAPRVAAAAGAGWRTVEVAQDVSDSGLLALAQDMCQ